MVLRAGTDGAPVSMADVQKMLEAADKDNDGTVDLDEFIGIMAEVEIGRKAGMENAAGWGRFWNEDGLAASLRVVSKDVEETMDRVLEPVRQTALVLAKAKAVTATGGPNDGETQVVHFAPFCFRAAAMFVNVMCFVILIIPFVVVQFFATILATLNAVSVVDFLKADKNDLIPDQIPDVAVLAVAGGVLFVTSLGYICLVVCSFHLYCRGQTLGHYLCGLQVLDYSLRPAGFFTMIIKYCFLRHLFGQLDPFVAVCSPGSSLSDMCLGTRVVVLPGKTVKMKVA